MHRPLFRNGRKEEGSNTQKKKRITRANVYYDHVIIQPPSPSAPPTIHLLLLRLLFRPFSSLACWIPLDVSPVIMRCVQQGIYKHTHTHQHISFLFTCLFNSMSVFWVAQSTLSAVANERHYNARRVNNKKRTPAPRASQHRTQTDKLTRCTTHIQTHTYFDAYI